MKETCRRVPLPVGTVGMIDLDVVAVAVVLVLVLVLVLDSRIPRGPFGLILGAGDGLGGNVYSSLSSSSDSSMWCFCCGGRGSAHEILQVLSSLHQFL